MKTIIVATTLERLINHKSYSTVKVCKLRVSLAICDHMVLPHRLVLDLPTCGGMGRLIWVSGYIPRWLTCQQTVTYPSIVGLTGPVTPTILNKKAQLTQREARDSLGI